MNKKQAEVAQQEVTQAGDPIVVNLIIQPLSNDTVNFTLNAYVIQSPAIIGGEPKQVQIPSDAAIYHLTEFVRATMMRAFSQAGPRIQPATPNSIPEIRA